MKQFFKLERNGKILMTGTTLGNSIDYFEDLAKRHGATVTFGDTSFHSPARPSPSPLIFNRTWKEIDAMQQKRKTY